MAPTNDAGGGNQDGFEFLKDAGSAIHFCAYCRQTLAEKVHPCHRCKALYHPDCWLENEKRCAIYGCEPVVRPAPPPVPPAPEPRTGNRSFITGGVAIACILLSGVLRFMTPAIPLKTPPVVMPPRPFENPFLNAEVYVHRAVIRQKAGDLQGALEDNSRAIEINPTLPVPYHNRAIIKVLQKDFQGALADYDRAILLDPAYAGAYRSRGFLKDGQGDFDGAIADCTRAIELDPTDGAAWRCRGATRQGRGDLDGAVSDYTRAVEVNPRDASAWSSLGTVHRIRKDLPKALAAFTRALEADPRHAQAWHHRGHTWSDLADFKSAAADFTKALEFDPETPRLFYDRACARYNLYAWQDALADFEAAAAKVPSLRDAAQLRIFLARCRAGRPEEAARGIRSYLGTRLPSDGSSWTVESLRFAAGDLTEQEYLERIPSTDGTPRVEPACEAYFLTASLRLIRGDAAGAKEYFSRRVATEARSLTDYDCSRGELKPLDAAPPK